MVTQILALTLIFRILSAQTTLCQQTSECADQNITTVTAACFAYKSCEDAVITGGTYAYCYGHESCDSATISSKNVYLYSYDSGSYSEISSPHVYSTGHYGGYAADIKASLVDAWGYGALRFATIEPINGTLTVNLFGYDAGNGASIKCYSGDDCYIYCRGNGCKDADFYCYSGATCTYYCNEVEDCPDLIGGPDSSLTDPMIDKIFEENRKKIIDKIPDNVGIPSPHIINHKPSGYNSPFDINSWKFATILCVLNAISIIFAIGFCIRNHSKGRYQNLNVIKKEVFE